jgi:hypothetical protein
VEIIFGSLSGRKLDTFLMPQNAWLLLNGFPDPAQAARAATNFIVNIKHLENGSPVAVTGVRIMVGTQRAIILSDINAAGPLMEHAMGDADFQGATGQAKKATAPKKAGRAVKKAAPGKKRAGK